MQFYFVLSLQVSHKGSLTQNTTEKTSSDVSTTGHGDRPAAGSRMLQNIDFISRYKVI